MKRTVVPGRAYAVLDVDKPGRKALAVALLGPDGWKVATAAGVVGVGLEQRPAIRLMMRAGLEAANRMAVALLAAGGAR